MNTERMLVAVFCDDVRAEVGNKVSLIGCYSADLLVPEFPCVLPKLVAYVRVYTPASRPIKRLHLRICLNADVLGESEAESLKLVENATAMRSSPTWHVATGVLGIAPLALTDCGEIRVEGETEEGPLTPARLRIERFEAYVGSHAPNPQPPSQTFPPPNP